MSTGFEPTNPVFEARVRDSFARQPFMDTLGARMTRVEPGLVEIEFRHRADLTQQHGYIHAGAVAGILDSACGYAAFSLMPAEAQVLTVEFKINLMRPASGSRFLARGRVIRPGRMLTTAAGDVMDVSDGEERPVASMLCTVAAMFDRPPEDE